jgi:hypothetical protein
VKNGYPTSRATISKLFISYNNFRDYCGEPHKIRTADISLEWIKSNSTIDTNDCWNWNNSLNEDGYGSLVYKSKFWLTHRLAYKLKYGDILEKLLIRHKCTNRKCCNPEHLELGTYKDNNIDTVINNGRLFYKNNNELSNQIRKLKTIEERINFYLKHSYVVEPNNCWISELLQKHSSGYYQINFNKTVIRLHRMILASKINKNYKDDSWVARHTCNNRSCINPEHLIEGSRSDNALDSRTNSKNTKITIKQVKELKEVLLKSDFDKHGSKKSFDDYWANKFNLSYHTIKNIRLGKAWKDI